MKKIIGSVLLIILALFLLVRYTINASFVSAYHSGTYKDDLEKSLLKLNDPQGWLPYYNLGNSAYMQEDYQTAVYDYEMALEENASHPNECSVRVNLALAMLAQIDFESGDSQSIVDQLLAARAVLTEEQCAGETEPDGHSEEAEELKKNIDDMLEQLGGNQGDDESEEESEDESDSESQESSTQPSEREEEIQQELEERMQENMENRQDIQESYSQKESGPNNQYGGKNW